MTQIIFLLVIFMMQITLSSLNACMRSYFFSRFPFIRVRPVIGHSAVRLLLLFFPLLLLLAFSLHFSSSSAFLGTIFTQASQLSCGCGLHRFLQHLCFFVSDLFGNLLSFILTMMDMFSPFHPDVNYFANYASLSFQLILLGLSFSLHQLFSLSRTLLSHSY